MCHSARKPHLGGKGAKTRIYLADMIPQGFISHPQQFYIAADKNTAMVLGASWDRGQSGDRLRQARIDKGMSIRDLAMASGLSTVTISNLESGRMTSFLINPAEGDPGAGGTRYLFWLF